MGGSVDISRERACSSSVTRCCRRLSRSGVASQSMSSLLTPALPCEQTLGRSRPIRKRGAVLWPLCNMDIDLLYEGPQAVVGFGADQELIFEQTNCLASLPNANDMRN